MNFNFLFKENIADLRLMLLERVWEQNPWSPAANGNEVVEGATAGVETTGNTAGNAAGTTTSTATTGATAGTLQPVNPFLFNGKAVDFTYNKDLSARLNRKLLKKKIKSMGGDKADATGMISEYWAQNGGASGSDKKWLDARASQYGYTTDANGNRDYHRKPSNWGKALATIGGTLLGGPVGGAAAYMWADLKSLIPGMKKGFFDPTSVKPAAQTQSVTEQPVVEQPAVEQPVTNSQPVTGFDPSKGVTFSGFSGDWGTRALLVYDANKNAEVWQTIAGDDNEITLDEFMAWLRANKVDGGVDGKLGKNSLAALGFGSLLGLYSWMNSRDQGGNDIKTSMGDTVVTPTSNHDPNTARLFADAAKYGYAGNSYELDGEKYITADDYNNWLSKQTAFDQLWIKAGATRVPIKGQAGLFAYKDKDGKVHFSNGSYLLNGLTYHTTGAITGANPGTGKYIDIYDRNSPFYQDRAQFRSNMSSLTDRDNLRSSRSNSKIYQVGNKTYYPVVTTGLGTDNRHNDRTFYYDPETQLYSPAIENWDGSHKGFMPSNSGQVNWYTWEQLAGDKVFSGTDYDKYKQGGVLRFLQGGQLDDQDKMLLASTLGMIGYAASQGKLMLIEEAAAQVASLALSQPEALLELASNKELVNAGVLAVGLETVQKLSQPGVMKLLLTQVSKMPKAMNGTKLNYIKELKGICPEGYEMQYFATGGNLCQRCAKSKKIEEAKCGKKMKKKHESGGVSKMMNSIKTSMKK